jgi:carbonic anhydrase
MTETIRANIDHIDGYFIVYEDDRTTTVFHPLQFHFHAPSEHTFDGKHYDLELHIYHIDITKKHKSVLAVYFDVEMGGDKVNPFITSVFETSDNKTANNQINWNPPSVSIE